MTQTGPSGLTHLSRPNIDQVLVSATVASRIYGSPSDRQKFAFNYSRAGWMEVNFLFFIILLWRTITTTNSNLLASIIFLRFNVTFWQRPSFPSLFIPLPPSPSQASPCNGASHWFGSREFKLNCDQVLAIACSQKVCLQIGPYAGPRALYKINILHCS